MQPNQVRQPVGQRAVVLGVGMGGLLAARVLAEVYEHVTVVERDPLPQAADQRRGVPQGRHVHNLHAAGVEILERLFPGLNAELAAAGAPTALAWQEIRMHAAGHPVARVDTGNQTVLASRPFLEAHVRERVRALPNVEVIDGCDAAGLVTTTAGDRVTAARILRHAPGSAEETLPADLVVDTMGRAGRTPAWLAGLGYQPPGEDRLHIGVGYATRCLRLPPGAAGGDKLIVLTPRPGHPRGMALFAQEDDCWLLTLFGIAGDHPPTDPDAFLTFARTVAPPDLYAAISAAEPLDGVVTHRFPTSVRRRYERLGSFPVGLLVLGDGICSLNPIYGQGMTLAAQQAMALRACLTSGTQDLARRFFTAAAKVIDPAWQLTTTSDLALPEIQGPRPLPLRLINAYMRRLNRTAEHDHTVAAAFGRVISLQDPPALLLSPAIAARVLTAPLRHRSTPTRSTDKEAPTQGLRNEA